MGQVFLPQNPGTQVPRSQQYHTFLYIQSTILHVFYATAGMCHVICVLHTDPALFTTSLQQLSGYTGALLLEHFFAADVGMTTSNPFRILRQYTE